MAEKPITTTNQMPRTMRRWEKDQRASFRIGARYTNRDSGVRLVTEVSGELELSPSGGRVVRCRARTRPKATGSHSVDRLIYGQTRDGTTARSSKPRRGSWPRTR